MIAVVLTQVDRLQAVVAPWMGSFEVHTSNARYVRYGPEAWPMLVEFPIDFEAPEPDTTINGDAGQPHVYFSAL